MIHDHMCCECESEWECYDMDCLGANVLRCDLCEDDEELPAAMPTDVR